MGRLHRGGHGIERGAVEVRAGCEQPDGAVIEIGEDARVERGRVVECAVAGQVEVAVGQVEGGKCVIGGADVCRVVAESELLLLVVVLLLRLLLLLLGIFECARVGEGILAEGGVAECARGRVLVQAWEGGGGVGGIAQIGGIRRRMGRDGGRVPYMLGVSLAQVW